MLVWTAWEAGAQNGLGGWGLGAGAYRMLQGCWLEFTAGQATDGLGGRRTERAGGLGLTGCCRGAAESFPVTDGLRGRRTDKT